MTLEAVGEFVKGAVEEGITTSAEFEDAKIMPVSDTPNEINLRLALKTGEQYDLVITEAAPVAAANTG